MQRAASPARIRVRWDCPAYSFTRPTRDLMPEPAPRRPEPPRAIAAGSPPALTGSEAITLRPWLAALPCLARAKLFGPTSELARLAHAISSTMPAIPSRNRSGWAYVSRRMDTPAADGSAVSFTARWEKKAPVDRLCWEESAVSQDRPSSGIVTNANGQVFPN